MNQFDVIDAKYPLRGIICPKYWDLSSKFGILGRRGGCVGYPRRITPAPIHLPIKYNLTTCFLWKIPQYDYNKYEKEVEEARRDPVIIHFTGNNPWGLSKQPKHPFASIFFKYQKETRWKDGIIDKRPFKLRVINYITDMLRKYGLGFLLPPSRFIDIAQID